MRFDLLVRRIMAPALGLALAATVAACGSSSSTPGSSSSSSPPAAASPASSPAATGSSAAPTSSGSGTTAQIAANWQAFFDGQTPAAKKVPLLQNGQKFAALIKAQAGSGMASTSGAKVTAVAVNSATSATVRYDITVSGSPVLSNQTGTAVYQDGTWKVGDVSFCQLLKLQDNGKTPSVCSG